MTDEARNEQQRIIGVFDRAASTYDRTGPRVFSHFGQRLVDLAHLAPGSRVLDVAVGRGAVLFPAARQVAPSGRAVGIDLSEDMVRETAADIRDARWQHVEIRQMDAEHLHFPERAFDCVLCGFSLWFFPRPHGALQEFSRVLKPGGHVGITTWAEDSPAQSFSRQVLRPHLPAGSSGRLRQGVTQFDSPPPLEAALLQTSFENVQILAEDADFTYADEDEWWASHWSRGTRGQLEKLTPLALELAKADAVKQVQVFKRSDGIHLVFRALFAFGTKPS